jgi:hypothetical protein
MRSSDLIRAARLDATLYEEVKANTTSTGSALGIVALVALSRTAREGSFERWPSSETPRQRAS